MRIKLENDVKMNKIGGEINSPRNELAELKTYLRVNEYIENSPNSIEKTRETLK